MSRPAAGDSQGVRGVWPATKMPSRRRGTSLRRTGLPGEQLLELYYWMRLTRSLEERLVNLYRQTKVVGGLFRSLGQEA